MERIANISFLMLALVPVALFFGYQNLMLIRDMSQKRGRTKPPGKRTTSRKPHTGKRRPQDHHSALIR